MRRNPNDPGALTPTLETGWVRWINASYGGEGQLVAPGPTGSRYGGFLPTLQLEGVRDGIEDLELYNMLDARVRQAAQAGIAATREAEALVVPASLLESVSPSHDQPARTYSEDPFALRAQWRAVVAAIESLLQPFPSRRGPADVCGGELARRRGLRPRRRVGQNDRRHGKARHRRQEDLFRKTFRRPSRKDLTRIDHRRLPLRIALLTVLILQTLIRQRRGPRPPTLLIFHRTQAPTHYHRPVRALLTQLGPDVAPCGSSAHLRTAPILPTGKLPLRPGDDMDTRSRRGAPVGGRDELVQVRRRQRGRAWLPRRSDRAHVSWRADACEFQEAVVQIESWEWKPVVVARMASNHVVLSRVRRRRAGRERPTRRVRPRRLRLRQLLRQGRACR